MSFPPPQFNLGAPHEAACISIQRRGLIEWDHTAGQWSHQVTSGARMAFLFKQRGFVERKQERNKQPAAPAPAKVVVKLELERNNTVPSAPEMAGKADAAPIPPSAEERPSASSRVRVPPSVDYFPCLLLVLLVLLVLRICCVSHSFRKDGILVVRIIL